MSALQLFLLSAVGYVAAGMWRQWQVNGGGAVPGQVRTLSSMGMLVAVLWGVLGQPFWRTVLMCIGALSFFALMLPDQASFFERHKILVFAVPFALGFTAANSRKGVIGGLTSVAVLAILLIAVAQDLTNDPITGPWWQSMSGYQFGFCPLGTRWLRGECL